MFKDLHFYIDLNIDDYFNNEADYLINLIEFIEHAYQHKSTVFYNKQKLDLFVKNCKDLDVNFNTSKSNQLDLILKDAYPIRDIAYLFEFQFAYEGSNLVHFEDIDIKSIRPNPKIGFIKLSTLTEKKVLLVKSINEFFPCEIGLLSDSSHILNWIFSKSGKRNFHLSPKHGENGKGNWKKGTKLGSSLLCSKTEAENLLNSALGDFKEYDQKLFNFDEDKDTFIEFYYEGDTPQKQWHGFHILKTDWEKRIPKSIRNHFGKT